MTVKLKQKTEESESTTTVSKVTEGVSKDSNSTAPLEFTDIVGSHGPWQKMILIITLISGFPVAWNHLIIGFYAFPVDHWCSRPQGSNISVQEWWRTSLPNATVDGKMQHSQCERYISNLTNKNEVIVKSVIPCDSWEYSTEYDLTITQEWSLVCDRTWLTSVSQSIYMGGFLVAVLLFGQLADIYGRHPIIFANIIIILVAGIATAFSTSFIMFTILRFFIAMGQSGLSLTAFVLMLEIVGTERRALYTLLQGFGWHFGYISLPLITWYITNWRHLQLAITLPCISFLLFYWMLPESPRWLLSRGKVDRAISEMRKAAKANKKEVDVETQIQSLCRTAQQENEGKKGATVIDLLITPNLRKKTLILYFIWMVIAFVYYGISLNVGDLGGSFHLNFFLAGAVEFPATILCIFTIHYYNRRIPFMLSLILSGSTCLSCAFIPENLYSLKVTLAMLGKMFISAAFTIAYIYSAELYPTVARNVGVGSSSTVARVGSMIAPFMKELGTYTSAEVPMALFGLLSFTSGLLVLILPETKGHVVPETIHQAEEFGKKCTEATKDDKMEHQ